ALGGGSEWGGGPERARSEGWLTSERADVADANRGGARRPLLTARRQQPARHGLGGRPQARRGDLPGHRARIRERGPVAAAAQGPGVPGAHRHGLPQRPDRAGVAAGPAARPHHRDPESAGHAAGAGGEALVAILVVIPDLRSLRDSIET